MNKQQVNSLKASLSIITVASRYLRLTRKGRYYLSLCPFHADKHPSLTFSPERNTYCCFACGAKGDAISLVQKLEACTFAEALSKLTYDALLPAASRQACGSKRKASAPFRFAFPESMLAPAARREAVITPAIEVENQRLLRNLLPYLPGCESLTRMYLEFEVGISPNYFSPALHLRSLTYMCGRIVFPIRNAQGALVGFSARRLRDDKAEVPKYINSSFADGFDKGAVLYGLHRALPEIVRTRTAYVVEGYKDAIALHAAGLTNSVALCGTAFTEQHAALLLPLIESLVLVLDGDLPGVAASQKIMDQMSSKVSCTQIFLPEGEDPDSMFRRYGGGELRFLLSGQMG